MNDPNTIIEFDVPANAEGKAGLPIAHCLTITFAGAILRDSVADEIEVTCLNRRLLSRSFSLAVVFALTLASTGCASGNREEAVVPAPAQNNTAPPPTKTDPAAPTVATANPQANTQTPPPTTPKVESADSQVVAKVGDRVVTMRQLQEPLIEAHGLGVLLNLVQLELARAAAEKAGVKVTPEDVNREHQLTVSRLFKDATPDQYPQLTEQLMNEQKLSRPEWDIVMEINANLRLIAEPIVSAKITDAMAEEYFKAQYGEKVKVRHIQVSNLLEINEAKRRLAAGETFADVARALSRNPRTAPLGGEMPEFSRLTQMPQSFKDAAFALQKPGDISDPVSIDDSYHLILLEQKIPPKVVKFEDVKASVREALQDQWLQRIVSDLRRQLGEQARATLVVVEPELKQQYEAKIKEFKGTLQSQEEYRREEERKRQEAREERIKADEKAAAATQATQPELSPVQPVTQPTTNPAKDVVVPSGG